MHDPSLNFEEGKSTEILTKEQSCLCEEQSSNCWGLFCMGLHRTSHSLPFKFSLSKYLWLFLLKRLHSCQLLKHASNLIIAKQYTVQCSNFIHTTTKQAGVPVLVHSLQTEIQHKSKPPTLPFQENTVARRLVPRWVFLSLPIFRMFCMQGECEVTFFGRITHQCDSMTHSLF